MKAARYALCVELFAAAIGALAALLGGLLPAWIKEALATRREERAADRVTRQRLTEQRRDAIESVARSLHEVPDHHSVPSHVVEKQRAARIALELTLGSGDGPIVDLLRSADEDQFDGYDWPVAPADVATSLLFEWHRGEVTALGAFTRYRAWTLAQRDHRLPNSSASLEP